VNLRPHSLLFALALLGAFAPGARGQLELPDEPVHDRGADAPGIRARGSGGTGGLLLPPASAPGARALPGTPGGELPGAPAPAAPAVPPVDSAAEFVLAEVLKLKDPAHVIVDHGVQSLIALGDSGRAVARKALASDSAPAVLLGARVLLQSPDPADRERVAARAQETLPRGACAPLADALAETDPVLGSPRLFAQLLMHPQAAMRAAAHRHLERNPSPALLAALMPTLSAKSSDTRLRGVQLISSVRDPAVMPLLLTALQDRSSRVCAHAMASLAVLDDERVDTELLRRAFSSRWILRDNAYAILTLVEREDRSLETKIGAEYSETLLQGLESSDPFVAGSCACALAGIGFRSGTPDDTRWLDRAVPHRLVRIVSGEDFHNDYTALRPIAERRLSLISGKHFREASAWIRWWTEVADSYSAHRAVLPATADDAATILLSVGSTVGRPESFVLLGPGLAPEAPHPPPTGAAGQLPLLEPETLRLSETQARDLYALLGELGVLGAERLPGQRGPDGAGRSLTVGIGGRTKEFRFAEGQGAPWFDNLCGAAASLRERNRWQRYPDPGRAPEAGDFWAVEHDWWDAHTDALERARRLKSLVFACLKAERPSQRSSGVAELVGLAGTAGAFEAGDFDALEELLRQETFIGARARQLIELATDCARPAPGAPPAPEFALRLVDALVATFQADGAVLVADLLRGCDPEFVRSTAVDDRPFVRAVAAAVLAEDADEANTAVLMRRLSDPVEEVEVAVVHALGENHVEAARTELLLRARIGTPPVRVAALEAIGVLGGENVFDALMVGLAERDNADVVTAAARGLASLGDPAAAPIFISLLSRGEDSPIFEHARRGLIDLGEAAWPDLLRVVHSPAHRQRREAALILAQQGVPEAASAMMTLLTDDPEDEYLARELAVLTCVDMRKEPDPAVAWWNWWESVVHDDSLAWLRAAAERLDLRAPPTEAFADGGTDEAFRFLLALIDRGEEPVAERARRELALRFGRGLGALPPAGTARETWIAAARAAVRGSPAPATPESLEGVH